MVFKNRVAARSAGRSTPRRLLCDHTAGRDVLLVGADRQWSRAIRAAAGDLGGIAVHAVASGRVALRRLMQAQRPYSQVLLNPARDDGLIPTLLSLTCDEAGSETSLLLLGRSAVAPSRACVVPGPARAAVLAALAGGCTRPAAAAPSLPELHRALLERRIDARYQPLVRMEDGRPAGVEALARLHGTGHGVLAPEYFVPHVEAAGLSAALTSLIAGRSFADITAPPMKALKLHVALNVPLDVLLAPEALRRLDEQRRAANVPASRVVIELTESRAVGDLPRLARAVAWLRDAGYGVSVDDVGPNVPNHEAILTLPFTSMKIDKEVVRRSGASAPATEFVRRIVGLAKERGLLVVAEGVHDAPTWKRMRRAGADLAQGFAIARPLPAAALPVWADAWRGRADLD
jgi:EAL domain-containing protein (putative c-di-GMP-specific phosphodiesterase class I)